MPEYPIQVTKVQAPPLREATLARDRLLEWLSVKVHGRVVLVIAEAGYGKTTLLADFSRRTRVRPLWFRLDRGDRDWVGFIAYLVAAVRVHVPAFAPITDSLIRETGASPPSRESVVDTFLRELGELAAEPAVLILDDFHLVDDSPDVRHVMKELLARAPERLSFVFISRRTPPLALARLRALGEVAEIGADDLRFDEAETARLFRETYEMRLDPSLVAELSRRTEGWAASLQLVRAALRGRSASEIRKFIHSLSGAEGDLYDYLAEEVVAELPPDLQEFLMRTSLLETIDIELGPVAGAVTVSDARRLIDEGEQLGLFGRRGAATPYQVRAHPLVRDFLQARLARSVGADGLRAIHLAIARAAEPLDWRIATHHYRAADSPDDARRVLSDSIETILGTGAYAAAEELATTLAETARDPVVLVLLSRAALQAGAVEHGLELAIEAQMLAPTLPATVLNLMTARAVAGDLEGALELGGRLEGSAAARTAQIGRAFRSMIATSTVGSLDEASRELRRLANMLRDRREVHFLGVALSNWAYMLKAQGRAEDAHALADESVSLLEATSARLELVSALLVRAWARAYLGDLDGARADIDRAAATASQGSSVEIAYEGGEIEVSLGDVDRARKMIALASERISAATDAGEQALLVDVWIDLRTGDLASAAVKTDSLSFGTPRTTPAFEARRKCARAALAVLRRDPGAADAASDALEIARSQGAWLWARCARLLHGLSGDDSSWEAIKSAGDEDRTILSLVAEAVISRVDALPQEGLAVIRSEAESRPERWRGPIRAHLGSCRRPDYPLAEVLAGIGQHEDVPLLRQVSKRNKGRVDLARSLARRLAPVVFVEDLGRVRLHVGDRLVEGSEVRRKVLALLCFLLTRPRFASTREEAVEALWPELDPASALNSLNQTVYFLRRVFEPTYVDDLSPGYVGQDSEMVWLDPTLVDSRSSRCREMVRGQFAADTEIAFALISEYRARFALDFAYEDWAAAHRDALHASFLRVVQHAIQHEIGRGRFDRAAEIAERALEVEPDADELQLDLVRLYRITGAHAAAAERYAQYAAGMRAMGLEPEAYDDLESSATRPTRRRG